MLGQHPRSRFPDELPRAVNPKIMAALLYKQIDLPMTERTKNPKKKPTPAEAAEILQAGNS